MEILLSKLQNAIIEYYIHSNISVSFDYDGLFFMAALLEYNPNNISYKTIRVSKSKESYRRALLELCQDWYNSTVKPKSAREQLREELFKELN